MKQSNIILHFHAHQPWQLKWLDPKQNEENQILVDELQSELNIRHQVREHYLPLNELLLGLIKQYSQIRLAISVSGTLLEQLHRFTPECLESFKELAKFPSVEFLTEPYYHSFSSVIEGDEFEEQVRAHVALLQELLEVRPTIVRNTDLIYDNEIGRRVSAMGFKGIFVDGTDEVLGSNSPNQLFHADDNDLLLFPRNPAISDQLANSFTSSKINLRLADLLRENILTILSIGYSAFCNEQRADSAVPDVLHQLSDIVVNDRRYRMVTPTELTGLVSADVAVRAPMLTSRTGDDRKLPALQNEELQNNAFLSLIESEARVKSLGDESILKRWRILTTSDYFYYRAAGATDKYDRSEDSGNTSAETYSNYLLHVQNFLRSMESRETDLLASTEKTPGSVEAERRDTHEPVWAQKLEHKYENYRSAN